MDATTGVLVSRCEVQRTPKVAMASVEGQDNGYMGNAYRGDTMITLSGTIKGDSYEDYERKATAFLAALTTRTPKYLTRTSNRRWLAHCTTFPALVDGTELVAACPFTCLFTSKHPEEDAGTTSAAAGSASGPSPTDLDDAEGADVLSLSSFPGTLTNPTGDPLPGALVLTFSGTSGTNNEELTVHDAAGTQHIGFWRGDQVTHFHAGDVVIYDNQANLSSYNGVVDASVIDDGSLLLADGDNDITLTGNSGLTLSSMDFYYQTFTDAGTVTNGTGGVISPVWQITVTGDGAGVITISNETRSEAVSLWSPSGWADGDVLTVDTATGAVTKNGSTSGIQALASASVPKLSAGDNDISVGAPSGLTLTTEAGWQAFSNVGAVPSVGGTLATPGVFTLTLSGGPSTGALTLTNTTRSESITVLSGSGWATSDVIVIDSGAQTVTKNGSTSGLSVRSPSTYPLLSPGVSNALEVGAPTGITVAVSVDYRARY